VTAVTTATAVQAAPLASRDSQDVGARRSAILSIGTAVPEHVYSQLELAEFMKQAHGADVRLERRLDVLYRQSAIRSRYSCLADYGRAPAEFTFYPPGWQREAGLPGTSRRMAIFRRAALPLARAAVAKAVAKLGAFDPRLVTHLVVASCTGFYAPGLDVELVSELGLGRDVSRIQVGFQGCHAGLTSLRLADSLCRADREALVLVVCIELCTLHLQIEPSDDNLLANSLFGDGAAALFVAGSRSGPALAAASGGAGGAGTADRLEIVAAGSWLEPGTQGEMAWELGDTGFQMRLSALVPRILGLNTGQFLATALALPPEQVRDLDFWAVHPGGPAILDQVERSLGLGPESLDASRAVLRDYGNMSSPTVFFVLARAWDELPAMAGRGVALAFGPGLTLEAVLLEAVG
jgi:alpha-pyrone synthase